jgi:hypothetical protein
MEETMLEILHFIFSSFWIWAGTVILVAIIADATVSMISAVRSNEKVKITVPLSSHDHTNRKQP